MLAHSKCSHQARVALPLHTPALPAPRFAAHGQMKSKESTSWFGWWPGLLAAAFLAAWLLLHAGTPSDALTSGGDARRCDCGPAGAAAPSVKPLPEIKLRAMIPLVLEIEKMQTGAELGVQVSWGVGGAHACSGDSVARRARNRGGRGAHLHRRSPPSNRLVRFSPCSSQAC